MPPDLHIDFEWRSSADIRLGPGTYFGAADSAPLCASFCVGGGPIDRWLPHEPCPPEIAAHATTGGTFVAHNAANFERHAVTRILTPLYGWPAIPVRQWRDTQAAARAMALPAALEPLAVALGLDEQKDKTGAALIKFFCIPRPDGLYNEPIDHPEKFAQFQAYCDQDVRTERSVDQRLVPLSWDEQDAWVLCQTINDRGIRIDRPSALAALRLVETAKEQADAAIKTATGGVASRVSDVTGLHTWLTEQGVPLAGLAKDDVLEALDAADLPDHVRRVLKIRQAGAKTSTAKIAKFLNFSAASGKIENRMIYHGTAPGRWAAQDPQLYNLPRSRPLYLSARENGQLDPNQSFDLIRTGSPDMLRLAYGDDLGSPLEFIADSLRGFLIASPGYEFVVVDYSSIQGVLAAWLAGEEWKLTAMRAIRDDPEHNPDLYRQAAARILGLPVEIVDKRHWARQAVGKTSELALQFQGSVSALSSMARNYGIRRRQLHDLYPKIWEVAETETREKAQTAHARALRSRNRQESDVLSREAWLACWCVVSGWRATNAAIRKSWTTLESAAREAVREPDHEITTLRGVRYLVKMSYLWCRLPSGRAICYPSPRLRDQVWARLLLPDGTLGESEVVDAEEARRLVRKGEAKIDGETSPKVTVLGRDPSGRKMMRYALYGGLILENLALGMERDILLRGMRNCEAAGYPIVYHVYDEATAEVPRGWGSVAEMERLMLNLSEWASDLPLSAHGYKSKRYRKD